MGVLISTTAGRSAFAEAWMFTPRASASAAYDSNVRLRTANAESDTSESLQVAASVNRSDESLSLALTPQVTWVRYQNDKALDRNDGSLAFDSHYAGEANRWDASLQYVRDTTLTSELGLTGLAEVNRVHESVSALFSPMLNVTERWSLSSTENWMHHVYEGSAATTGLFDYDYAQASIRTGYSINERSGLFLDATYGRLTAEGRPHSNSLSANAIYQYALSEQWTSSVSIGPTQVDSGSGTENGLGYSVDVTRKSDVWTFSLHAARDITPTGRGLLSKRQRVEMSVAFPLTERVGATLSTQWARTQDVLSDYQLQLDATRYTSASGAMSYSVTPTVRLSAYAAWSKQRSERILVVSEAEARASRIGVALSWVGLGQSL